MYEIDNEEKIKFYSMGSEKLDINKIKDNISIDKSKKVMTSNHFNKAMKKVIKKDISLLSSKVIKITSNIMKRLTINEISIEVSLEPDICNMDKLINDTKELTSKLIEQKGKYKISVFSANKKGKKEKNDKLNSMIDYLSKYENDFISIKNEYNKLMERNVLIEDVDDDLIDEVIKEDPLERTINFYMNKQKRD